MEICGHPVDEHFEHHLAAAIGTYIDTTGLHLQSSSLVIKFQHQWHLWSWSLRAAAREALSFDTGSMVVAMPYST